ncbi:acyl-CoA carboxylase epsilon subunit [Catenulispora rubra]|uniref:acyl-CoA carboxylase epsilon subunit n=1 Tax=Catenulispora rubra TaxID=280293 RepID=UPI0034DD5128
MQAASQIQEPTQVRVLHGDPTPEEVAVVVAVVAAAVASAASRSSNDGSGAGPRSGWMARERNVRGQLHPGPGGWRASAFPQAR